MLLVCFLSRTVLAQSTAQNLDRFRAETNLLVRHELVSDLMQARGEPAFLEFELSLFDKNTTRKLNVREEAYMLSLVGCMGYLAVTSNIARDFLIEAINPQFWRTNISWKTDLGERQYSVLAGRALVALAVSGRQEFDAMAEKIKNDPGVGDDGLAGPLFDAYFRKQLLKKEGWASYLKMSAEEISWACHAWIQTPTGTNWFQWSLSVDYPNK